MRPERLLVLLHPLLGEISKEFFQKFISNYTRSFNIESDFNLLSPIIQNQDNEFLTKDVLGQEIKSTSFDLAPDKSSDPNAPFFFQKYWPLKFIIPFLPQFLKLTTRVVQIILGL